MPQPPHRRIAHRLAASLLVATCALHGCDQSAAPPPPAGPIEPVVDVREGGTLTLTIDGTSMAWAIGWSGWLNTDRGNPDGVEINGERVRLTGPLDADSDGDHDEDDKIPYDEREEVMAASITGKTVAVRDDSTLTLADGRQFGVEGGTVTITGFERGAGNIDRITADVALTLRLEGRTRPATGTLTTSMIGVW